MSKKSAKSHVAAGMMKVHPFVHPTRRVSATVADRMQVLEQRLIALEGAVRLLDVDETDRVTCSSKRDLKAAALDDLGRCFDELTWLQNLPDHVLQLPAPTDDDVEAQEKLATEAAAPQGGAR